MKKNLSVLYYFFGSKPLLLLPRFFVNVLFLLVMITAFIFSVLISRSIDNYFLTLLGMFVLIIAGNIIKEKVLAQNLIVIEEEFMKYLKERNELTNDFKKIEGKYKIILLRLAGFALALIPFLIITFLLSLQIALPEYRVYILLLPIIFAVMIYSFIIKPLISLGSGLYMSSAI
jgi:hypothetical protein